MYLIWIYDDLWSFEAPVSPCQVESRALHHLPDGSLTTGRLMSFAVSDTERGQLATCALWVLGSTLPSEEPSGPYRGFSFACSQANQGSTVITNILPIYYTNILPHNTTRSVSCRAFFALLSAAFSKKPLLSVGLSYLVSNNWKGLACETHFRAPWQCPWPQAQLVPRPQGWPSHWPLQFFFRYRHNQRHLM